MQRVILVVLAAVVMSPLTVGAQESNLPAGYYVYLGTSPGKTPPKGFTISELGNVTWQQPVQSVAADKPKAAQAKPAASTSTAAAANVQWDEYNYPRIKWKARQMTTVTGGIAQLETTYDPTGTNFTGKLRYKLLLFKVPNIPYRVTVQLLDESGFKIKELHISKDQFRPIPGTELFEATEEANSSDLEYQRIRDYTVQ